MCTKLSICIATYMRSSFIGETLDSIMSQIDSSVEIVVVDGASPDSTPEVMSDYARRYPMLRYFRESENSGVDADFDKAVGYARGEYCWLMTDDDLLKPGAIARVLYELNGEEDLVIVNAEVRSLDLSDVIESRRLQIDTDRVYREGNKQEMFADTAAYLSFIGCVVMRRSVWLARDRRAYYGSLFVHVGVIFQEPALTNVKVIAQPQIAIRYGNAMWTPRGFEIWMFKWPQLIWSFPEFSDFIKNNVSHQNPWRSAKALFHNRALGSYSRYEFYKFWPIDIGGIEKAEAYCLSVFPASLANAAMVLYFSLIKPMPLAVHDLLFSRNAGRLSRLVARIVGANGH